MGQVIEVLLVVIGGEGAVNPVVGGVEVVDELIIFSGGLAGVGELVL